MGTYKCLDCPATVRHIGQRCRPCYNQHRKDRPKYTSFKSPAPYVGFDVYGPRTENSGRLSVSLRNAATQQQFTMTVARYLFSVGLGRVVERKYHVDHQDGNSKNNAPQNLQLLTGAQNRSKGSRADGSHTHKTVTFTCPVCQARVVRRDRKPSRYDPVVFLCSRGCMWTFNSLSKHYTNQKVVRASQRANCIVRGFAQVTSPVVVGIRLLRVPKRLLRVVEALDHQS